MLLEEEMFPHVRLIHGPGTRTVKQKSKKRNSAQLCVVVNRMVMWRSFVAVGLMLLLSTIVGAAQKLQSTQSPLVQIIAGIRVGPDASTDGDVTKAYGPGLFTDEEGHGGGRYFTDPSKSITLHIEIGVDNIIDHVELTQGLYLPKELKTTDPAFVSQTLPKAPTIDKGLRLGMSGSEIIKKLGPPKKDRKTGNQRTIIYESTVGEDPRVLLFYEAKFTLVSDRLTKISLYDGE